MSQSSLTSLSILCGSQLLNIDPLQLNRFRENVREDSQLSFLQVALSQLVDVWEFASESFQAQWRPPQKNKLAILQAFLNGQDILGAIDNQKNNNILLAPLTVALQIVKLLQKSPDSSISSLFQANRRVENVQGFCIGFLTAIVIAYSSDEAQFRILCNKAINLAMCIGAIVDNSEDSIADSNLKRTSLAVRWKSESHEKRMKQLVDQYPDGYIASVTDTATVTVTLPIRDVGAFQNEVLRTGGFVKPVPLRGRYHHPVHAEAVKCLSNLCSKDERFQLISSRPPKLPLRSTIDAQMIDATELHKIALDAILLRQAKWFQTVEASVVGSGRPLEIFAVGTCGTVAKTISDRLQRAQTSSTSNLPAEVSDPSNGSPNSPRGTSNSENLMSSSIYTTSTHNRVSPVAVVGMSCRFPEADTIDEFWTLLKSGVCAAKALPEDRFKLRDVHRKPHERYYGNFLRNPHDFDHRFFKISGREAKSMDPQQRLILEVAYEALESSSYFGRKMNHTRESNIGCYIGVGSVDYDDNVASEDATAFSATGTLRAFISGKVSHYFGWHGPSITYDTACSSSAVAIHSACRALQSGDCVMAVAGGVNVITSPKLFQNLGAANFLSPTGASRAFDSEACGYCRGEGAGLIVLKPLSQAEADHDSILAIIPGTAVNQGSNCSPITVPHSESQSGLYCQALKTARVDAHQVSYVEAHGTGTQVGDPIEYESVNSTFGDSDRPSDLFLGSVKDNIGHLEAASGIAGVIKTILMIQHATIPRQPNFRSLNPKIVFNHENRIKIPTATEIWQDSERTALVTNYGAAGSNAAIVVQGPRDLSRLSASKLADPLTERTEEWPVVISARTDDDLRSYCRAIRSRFVNGSHDSPSENVADVAYNLSSKQNTNWSYEWTGSVPNLVELDDNLRSVTSAKEIPSKPTQKPSIILCLAGQNGQAIHISKQLFDNCSLLRHHLIECDSVIQELKMTSIFPTIFDPLPTEHIPGLHCALFSIQYSCARSWIDSGLEVDTIIGHSFGQLTALCIAGSLSLRDTLLLVSSRAHAIQDLWGTESGAMLSVEGAASEIDGLLQANPDCKAELACRNGPRNFVIAGTNAEIDDLEQSAAKSSILPKLKTKRLETSHAFHSRLTEPILSDLSKVAQGMTFHKPRIQIETCSQGSAWQTIDSSKIIAHTRDPVYFHDAVQRIKSRVKSAIWLDAGCGPSVIHLVKKSLEDGSEAGHHFQALDLGKPNAQSILSRATCKLWGKGSNVNFWLFHPSQTREYSQINLPPYQFNRTRHWIDYKEAGATSAQQAESPATTVPQALLQRLESHDSRATLFLVNICHQDYQFCARGHAVSDQPLCPASMYVELVLQATRQCSPQTHDTGAMLLESLVMSSPLGVNASANVFLELSGTGVNENKWQFCLYTKGYSNEADKKVHASGSVSAQSLNDQRIQLRLRQIKRLVGSKRCNQVEFCPSANGLQGNTVYSSFSRVVTYADYYRYINKVYAIDREVVGHVRRTRTGLSPLNGFVSDPLLMDNFLQVAGIHVNCLTDCKPGDVFLCISISEVLFSATCHEVLKEDVEWTVFSNFEVAEESVLTNDILVLHPASGDVVFAILGAQFKRVPLNSLARTLAKINVNHEEIQNRSAISPSIGNSSREPSIFTESPSASTPRTLAAADDEENRADGVPSSVDQVTQTLRKLLSEIMASPIRDITANSSLSDLGVDSLLITEVIGEISKQFGIDLTIEELQQLNDLRSIAGRLLPTNIASNGHQRHLSNEDQDAVHQHSPLPRHPGTTPGDRSNPQIAIQAQARFDVLGTYDEFAQQAQFSAFCSKVYPFQSELVTAYIVEAFESLGCRLQSIPHNRPIPDIDVDSKHLKLKSQLYKALEDAELIHRTNEKSQDFLRTSVAVPQQPAETLKDAIIARLPQHSSEHILLHSTASRLAECLTNRVDPIALMFGSSQARELLEDVYTNAPMFKAGNTLLAKYLREVLKYTKVDRPIEILELGAGTGGTTGYLLNAFKDLNVNINYTFTDLSSSLVAAAKKKFAKYPFMEYTVLDIEKDPTVDLQGQYDIIISTNCIHATRNLTRSSSNIKHLLQPSGVLCLVELTRNLYWFDLVFGLLQGWWLFDDDREHVLASEHQWWHCLEQAGYRWIDWSTGEAPESEILRIIVASPSNSIASTPRPHAALRPETDSATRETVFITKQDGTDLFADIHYPKPGHGGVESPRPIALMIHGGGHIMLSRKDIRPRQTETLLNLSFLPISIDYRLCPETTLEEGPIHDVCTALTWARQTLPHLRRRHRPDIVIDPARIVAVGWSTGGHLAMSLAWSAPARNIAPPDAILAFYCPLDYEDTFWSTPSIPRGSEAFARDQASFDLREAVYEKHITAYNVPATRPGTNSSGNWNDSTDPRSRMALLMNIRGQTLSVLCNGLTCSSGQTNGLEISREPKEPTRAQMQAVSPLWHIRNGDYTTPTFIVHGTDDDLIPVAQAQRVEAAMAERGVPGQVRVVEGAVHLFDLEPGFERNGEAKRAVSDGYDFLRGQVFREMVGTG